jgi:hypothetical protein
VSYGQPSAGRHAPELPRARCILTTLAVLATPLCAPPAAGQELELGRGNVSTAGFGDAQVNASDHHVTARGHAAGIDWQLGYAYRRFEYQGVDSRDRDLHRLALALRWDHASGALRRTLEVRPVIATSSNVMKDFVSRGSADDLMLHGVVRLERAAARGWGWQVGLARDDVFGAQRFYPVAAATWTQRAFRAELGWPESRLDWQPAPGLSLGAGVAPAGNRWHVVSDERDGAEFSYELRAWRAGFDGRWHFGSGWAVIAQAGREFERRHRFEDDTGVRIDRRAAAAPYTEFGLAYRW